MQTYFSVVRVKALCVMTMIIVMFQMEMKTRPAWHYSVAFNQAVDTFHDKYARPPTARKMEAEVYLKRILSAVQPHLKAQKLCSRIEYTGSSYQDLRVNDNRGELEFDVVLILDTNVFDCKPHYAERKPGYFMMTSDDTAHPAYSPQGGDGQLTGIISGKSMTEHLFKVLSQLRLSNPELRKRVKLHDHSPAVMMEVRKEDQTVWFCVDLVPTYEVQECNDDLQCVRKRWVPKAYSTSEVSNGIFTHLWYQSFAVEETRMFAEMGTVNDARKKVGRILKMLVHFHPQLSLLSSYMLKTVLLNHLQNDPRARWANDTLGLRLTELLNRLAVALDKNCMKHHFVDCDNLLKALPVKDQKIMSLFLRDMLKNLHGILLRLNVHGDPMFNY